MTGPHFVWYTRGSSELMVYRWGVVRRPYGSSFVVTLMALPLALGITLGAGQPAALMRGPLPGASPVPTEEDLRLNQVKGLRARRCHDPQDAGREHRA